MQGLARRSALRHTRRVAAGYIAPLGATDQEDGFVSAEGNTTALNQHSPWWYCVNAAANALVVQSAGVVEEVARTAALQARGSACYPSVSNHRAGVWTNDHETMLGSSANRSAFITTAVNLANANGYAGLDIDFEDTINTLRAAQSQFAVDLGAALRAAGKKLVFTVFAKETDAGYNEIERNGSQDYAALGAASDWMRIMVYDWNWQTAPNAGPIAPYWWIDSVSAYAASVVTPSKIILGSALWGYDWPINAGTTVNGVTSGAANVLTYAQVQALLATYSITPTWDPNNAAYWFRYTAGAQLREVWYEDARSIGFKVDVILARGLGGIMFWRLGNEDPAIWPMIRQRLNA